MNVVTIDHRDATPIHVQLERGLRAAIVIGRLKAGDQLPTVRQLAVTIRVNANTVARVYSVLERDGIVETRRGIGTFVLVRPEQAWPPGERERRLRALAVEILADTMAAGFGIEEMFEEVTALIQEKTETIVSDS
jgi:GntR family transcriptional regulator